MRGTPRFADEAAAAGRAAAPEFTRHDRQSRIAQEMFEDRALELGEARIAAPLRTLGIDGEIECDADIVDNENPVGESDRQL